MRILLTLAGREIRDGLRNRWVVAVTLLLAALALTLAVLGSAPTGTVGAAPLEVAVVSLASLTVFLLPLIALLLSYDAVVGEHERGTLLLLMAYPVRRWQVIAGKFIGHLAILAFATVVGYGAAGLAIGAGQGAAAWQAFGIMIGTSIVLGASFLALGYLASALVAERATAAGIAVGLWLAFVLLFDMLLLGALVFDQGRVITADVLGLLLMLNPADIYRMLNLLGMEGVRQVGGLAGLGAEATPSPWILAAAMGAWVLVPLALAAACLSRKQL